MDQTVLLMELYRACVEHDEARQRALILEEFKKVFERRSQGMGFDTTWTVVRG